MAYTKTTWITGSTPLSANNMNHIEQGIKDAHDMIAAITETIFPVGAYFETSNSSFNPNGTFAGTWILEKAGQVHVSAGSGYPVSGALSNQSDGGSKDAIIPYHNHTIPALSGTAASNGAHTHTISASSASAGGHTHTANSNGAHTHTITSSCASAGAHTHGMGDRWSDGSGSETAYKRSDDRKRQTINTSSAGAHTHTITSSCGSAGAHTHTTDSQGSHSHTISASSASAGAHTHTVSTTANNTGYVGVSGNVNNANMMPYINVYRWHRTA